MNAQLLIDKWSTLESDEQEKVLAFMDAIYQQKQPDHSSELQNNDYEPQTELGKKLWEIRQRIIKDSNVKLLDWDDIETELDEIRGRNR